MNLSLKSNTAYLNRQQPNDVSFGKRTVAIFDQHWTGGTKDEIVKKFADKGASDCDVLITSEPLTPQSADKLLGNKKGGVKGDELVLSPFISSYVPKEIIDKYHPDLIAIRGAGFDKIDAEACHRNNTVVENTAIYEHHTVAHHTMALLLDVAKQITKSNEALKTNSADVVKHESMELVGKTMGIIGAGRIGSEVAKLAKAFGMEVLICDAYKNPEFKDDEHVKYTDKDSLLKKSDVISLNAPYTGTPILDKAAFDVLSQRETAPILVNSARGENIDQDLLLESLNNGKIRGAGVDVLTDENILFKNYAPTNETQKHNHEINKQLLEHPNVVVTPHFAYNTPETKGKMLDCAIDNILSFFQGKLKNVVINNK